MRVTIVKKDGAMMDNNPSYDEPNDKDDILNFVPLQERIPNMKLPDSLIINTLMTNSEDMIYFKDHNSKFILSNRAHAHWFGLTNPRDLIGKCDGDFYPKDFADKLCQDENEIMRTGVPVTNKMEKAMYACGPILALSSSKYPLYDLDGKIMGTWGISRDMTKLVMAEEEAAKANAKLKLLAMTDDLTKLFNQRHFYDSLEKMISLFSLKKKKGLSADFSLIILDIDFFKTINDTYGHVIGDTALRYVSGLILAHTRTSDTAFRYGGDEFSLILQDTDLTAGMDLAERLRRIVEQNPLLIDEKKIDLTISLGVVCFEGETSTGELVQKADTKLYQAKNEGRNRVC